MGKVCTNCKEKKDESAFGKDKYAYDGMTHQCKTCRSKSSRAWDKRNREHIKKRQKEWRHKNKDKVHEYNQRQYWKDPEKRRQEKKEWVKNNPEKARERNQRYYEKNKEYKAQKHKEWREKNKEYRKIYNRLYYEENGEHIRKTVSEYQKNNRKKINDRLREKRENDPVFKSRHMMRSMLYRLLGDNKQEFSSNILGYTAKQLKERIEFQFKPGMTWNNHGRWHVDHRLSMAYLQKKGENRPHIVNALSNLEPVWAEENLKKGQSSSFTSDQSASITSDDSSD